LRSLRNRHYEARLVDALEAAVVEDPRYDASSVAASRS
jgi:hypothetical protein